MALISMSEYARRVKATPQAVRYALLRGRIKGKKIGQKNMIDESELAKWKVTNTSNNHHVYVEEVSEEYEMPLTDKTFPEDDKIPEEDFVDAPYGTLVYYQAKKTAIDVKRNQQKYLQEIGNLIRIEDATLIFADALSNISTQIQTIPAKTATDILNTIEQSVQEWNNKPVNLRSQIYNIIDKVCTNILNLLSKMGEPQLEEIRKYSEQKGNRKRSKPGA